MLYSPTNPDWDGIFGSSGDIDVRPLQQQKFGRSWSQCEGMHKRRQTLMIPRIRIDTLFQEELNKVKVGRRSRAACNVQGRNAVWIDSVGVR
jgi:hypothetical protein